VRPPGKQANRDRRIEMPARDVTDRIGHRHDGQAEGQRHADQANADLGNLAANTALPQPPNTSQRSR
jgi:hypothetical protein